MTVRSSVPGLPRSPRVTRGRRPRNADRGQKASPRSGVRSGECRYLPHCPQKSEPQRGSVTFPRPRGWRWRSRDSKPRATLGVRFRYTNWAGPAAAPTQEMHLLPCPPSPSPETTRPRPPCPLTALCLWPTGGRGETGGRERGRVTQGASPLPGGIAGRRRGASVAPASPGSLCCASLRMAPSLGPQ